MKILLAPDSFKGSLAAMEVARAMGEGVRRVWPAADIRLLPMADGGEGTLDAVLAATGGERLKAVVPDAAGNPAQAEYGLLGQDGMRVAVLEAAQVVGLTSAGDWPVGRRTTLGLGELVRHCLDQGIRHFMVGLGGSSTNDGGAGVLVALGARLLARDGRTIEPTPEGLAELDTVDFSNLDVRLGQAEITVMSDVLNPLAGAQGATAVFGPQKGVSPEQVPVFDSRLARLGGLCDAWYGSPLSTCEGTGAAGGLGYAFQLLGGRNRSGAEVVCDLLNLDEHLVRADWLITGEGRSDSQTLQGKVPFVVAQHARRQGVPVTLLSGALEAAALPDLSRYFDGCFSIVTGPMSLEEAMRNGALLLASGAEQLACTVRPHIGYVETKGA